MIEVNKTYALCADKSTYVQYNINTIQLVNGLYVEVGAVNFKDIVLIRKTTYPPSLIRT